MPHEGSVTGWLQALRSGDSAAARRLWDRYFTRMVAVDFHDLRRDLLTVTVPLLEAVSARGEDDPNRF
jgi:hypothetical protein